MDGGAWWATVHGVAKSGTRLSDFTFTFPGYFGHELKQAPGDSGGQGGLLCCSPWVYKESDTIWQLYSHMGVIVITGEPHCCRM